MKKILFIISVLTICCFSFYGCKSTFYSMAIDNSINTQVHLDKANFRVLGSFTGTASERKNQISIKNNIGLMAQAKADMLSQAKSAGIMLNESRTLANVTIDKIENMKRITVTYSAEIIEFK